jgi:hypothetical protein
MHDAATVPMVWNRSKVLGIEEEMRKYPQLDLPVRHHFSQGVYARELFIPKGTLLTGQIHKYEQLNIMSKGEMSVLVDFEWKRVRAPFHVVSPPGTKRIAYAHEDTVWTTIHGTELRDLGAIEAHYIAQSEAEYLEFTRQIEGAPQACLG